MAALLLAGCLAPEHGPAPAFANGLDVDGSPWEERPTGAHPTDEARLTGPLTPDGVAELVAARNPDALAALERWVAHLEQVPQRASLPDPWLRYGYSSMFKMHTVELMQEVPFPGKLLAQGRAAVAEARAMRAALSEQTNLLRAQTRSGLAGLYLARRALALLDEHVALMERFVEIARSRYAVGAATQPDVLRAEVTRDALRVEREGARREVQVAESGLNVLLDRPPDAPLGPVLAPEVGAPPEPLAVLFERALRQRPDLAGAAALVDAEVARRDRAELEWVPDLVVGGGYVRDAGAGADELEVSGGVSLPIWWGRLRGGVAEARANVRRAEAEARAARSRVLDEVRRAAARVRAADAQARLLAEEAVPRARQNVAVSEAAYVAGRIDFLALIDAQRMQLDQELALERVRAERAAAEAELRRSVGGAEEGSTGR
ncbi:MAG: TolC family protein [Planctomycetes bacterium]|nr:TolC family protein [Planctomycetota bacterium]